MNKAAIREFHASLDVRRNSRSRRGRGNVAFRTVGDMVAAIEAYFARCNEDEPPSITGLANSLGISTETLRVYGEKDKFCDVVRTAKQVIAAEVERRLWNRETAPGAKFWLQTNMGWTPTTATEISGPDRAPVQIDYEKDLAAIAALIEPIDEE